MCIHSVALLASHIFEILHNIKFKYYCQHWSLKAWETGSVPWHDLQLVCWCIRFGWRKISPLTIILNINFKCTPIDLFNSPKILCFKLMVHLFEKNGYKNGENDTQTISSQIVLLVTCLGYPGNEGKSVHQSHRQLSSPQNQRHTSAWIKIHGDTL